MDFKRSLKIISSLPNGGLMSSNLLLFGVFHSDGYPNDVGSSDTYVWARLFIVFEH